VDSLCGEKCLGICDAVDSAGGGLLAGSGFWDGVGGMGGYLLDLYFIIQAGNNLKNYGSN